LEFKGALISESSIKNLNIREFFIKLSEIKAPLNFHLPKDVPEYGFGTFL
jgi:hypothetical protein